METLNDVQRAAATAEAPLLIIAGAGTGKTLTLVHRVAHLVRSGADPERILLLTFSRRAAGEMTRRAERIVSKHGLTWAGTFHSIANRLLRLHATSVGLNPAFTILDRSDSADLLDLVRHDLGFAKKAIRFPLKSTCLSIYSRVVNERAPLDGCLDRAFPWCAQWKDELQKLFAGYVEAKLQRAVLDYDDLLLYWTHLLSEPALAARVRKRFDHVLVDEYQDTSLLQEEVLRGLCPDGRGLTVVGDDAQSIYSFRAATVRNILDFPDRYGATVVKLEQNYRSTEPVLSAANAVIGLARRRHEKTLFSGRASSHRPVLVTAEDERAQVDYVVEQILAEREAGILLKQQAVLFRTAHHSDLLEIELGRRNIPFVKYGGLKFLEAAHVKDLLAILRWAENPRDTMAALRVLKMIPGIGPASAERALAARLESFSPPAAARTDFASLLPVLACREWPAHVGVARRWYEPHLHRLYEETAARLSDLNAIEQLASIHPSRERFLSELTLDPPEASGDHSGAPFLDEDYLILSTIHSAKGQEWHSVYLLSAADGCIPSDLSTGDDEQIEEERRLLYVAMTRAKESLHIVHPLRFWVRQQARYGDRHLYTPRSRFLPDEILGKFEQKSFGRGQSVDEAQAPAPKVDVAQRLRDMWRGRR